MLPMVFVDLGRQHGIHDYGPYEWFGGVAEGCPLVAGERGANVMADRAGRTLVDRDGTTDS